MPGVLPRKERSAVRGYLGLRGEGSRLGYLYELTVVLVSGPHDLSINCLVCLGMD